MDGDGDYVVTWTDENRNGGVEVMARRYSSAGVAQGNEFQVNTSTNGIQDQSSVAMDADGDFVITWSSDGQDGNGSGVYARRFNAIGVAQGPEFRVNTFTAGNQILGSIAMAADGDFVITWQSVGQDGSGTGVYAQRYSESAVAQGVEFRVNSVTAGDQTWPVIAMDNAGNFVIGWVAVGQAPGGNNAIEAQRYSSSGTALGTEVRVDTLAASNPDGPSVAMDSDGHFAFAWTADTGGADGLNIAARRFDPTGTAIDLSEFRVNVYTTGSQAAADVAMDADGDIAILWTSTGQDGSGGGQYLRQISKFGTLSGETRVNTVTTQSQRFGSLAMDARGDMFVVWSSFLQDGDEYGVFGQRYAKDGADDTGPVVADVLAAGVTVPENQLLVSAPTSMTVTFSENLATAGPGSVTSISNWALVRNDVNATNLISGITFGKNAATGKYEAVITFTAALSPGRYQLIAFDSIRDIAENPLDGNLDGASGGFFTRSFQVHPPVVAGPEFRVNTYTTGQQQTPSVATDANGNYVVVWDSSSHSGSGPQTIYAQRFNSSGVPQGEEFHVVQSSGYLQYQPSVAMDATGAFVICWVDSGADGSFGGIYARRFAADGVALGDAFLVASNPQGDQTWPAIAMSPKGEFVITWESLQDGSNYGIFARRFSAAGLAVGAEFAVDSSSSFDQQQPAVAIDSNGDFAIAWTSDGQDGDGSGIYARSFNAAGTPISNEFQVNAYAAGSQQVPSIAMDAAGNFVVAWATFRSVKYDVDVRRFSLSGSAISIQFNVSSNVTGSQFWPSVAMDADGDFIVSWDSSSIDANGSGVSGRRFNALAAPQGVDFQINTWIENSQFFAQVTSTPGGDFIVVWMSIGQDGDAGGIYARRYSASGLAPTNIALPGSIPENRPGGSLVSSFTTLDSDPGDEFSYALVGGTGSTDNATFFIYNNQLYTNATFDYETQSTYSVRVRVTDSFGLTFEKALTVNVANVFEIPQIVDVRVDGSHVNTGGQVTGSPTAITMIFNEIMTTSGPGDYTSLANWSLTRSGVSIPINSYSYGTDVFGRSTITFYFYDFSPGGTLLVPGDYLLTGKSSLADRAGTTLDGDLSGAPGGDFLFTLKVRAPQLMGPEFRVNTTTTGGQSTLYSGYGVKSVATDHAGNFVSIWVDSSGLDGDGTGIYGQRFRADGTPLGSEFRINTATARSQDDPAIAMDYYGNFIVSWTSYATDFQGDIVAQIFDAAGNRIGGEFNISTSSAGQQSYSAVAMDLNGGFVVTWTNFNNNGTSTINARRFANGGATPNYQLTPSGGFNYGSDIAMTPGGDFVLTWTSSAFFGAESDIFVQRFASDMAPQSSATQFNSYTAGSQYTPSIAIAWSGDFVVAWYGPGDTGSGVQYGVHARQYFAAFNAVGADFPLASLPGTFNDSPVVAMDFDGDFVAAWSSSPDGGNSGIAVRRFNKYGVAQGAEVFANSTRNDSQYLPAVAMDYDGDFVLNWTSENQDGSGSGVYGQRFQGGSVPTALTLSSTSIPENRSAGAVVGTFSTSDVDSPEAFTYSLVSGPGATDNPRFTIAGNQLRTAALFDYETKSSYSIRVRVTDLGRLSYEQSLTIVVSDVNEAPTGVVLTDAVSTRSENASAMAAVSVATISITDDALGTNTLSLSGSDVSFFEIVGNQLRLKAGTVLDYETKSSYSVRINVDDASIGGTPDAFVDYTLSITDVEEIAPTVSFASLPAIRTTATGLVTLNFSEDVTGVSLADFTLTRDGSSVDLTGVPLVEVTPRQYTLDLSTVTAAGGNYVLTLTASGSGIVDAASNALAGDATASWTNRQITGFVVQNGQAQRSFLNKVDVTLAGSFDLAALQSGGRIRLMRYDLNGLNGVAVSYGAVSRSGGTLNFDWGARGIGGNRNSTAGDGYYVLEFDLDADNTFESSKRFYRLTGDVNGDRAVNSADASLVQSQIGQPYNSIYDLDGNGVVDARDRLVVQRSINKQLDMLLLVDG